MLIDFWGCNSIKIYCFIEIPTFHVAHQGSPSGVRQSIDHLSKEQPLALLLMLTDVGKIHASLHPRSLLCLDYLFKSQLHELLFCFVFFNPWLTYLDYFLSLLFIALEKLENKTASLFSENANERAS